MPFPTLDVWQRAAVALDEWSCGYDAGRSKDDPVYLREVTEGRDYGAARARYSSCGDRFHWRQFRLGVREDWVNRAQHKGWKVGQNISKIASIPWAAGYGKALPEFLDLLPGDELLIWNNPTGTDAHSLSITQVSLLDVTTNPGGGMKLTTANYGAGGMSPSAMPGARIGTAQLVYKRGVGGLGHYYGTRKLQRVVRLSDIVKHITAKPDLSSGTLSLTGEDIDALELGWNSRTDKD